MRKRNKPKTSFIQRCKYEINNYNELLQQRSKELKEIIKIKEYGNKQNQN